MKAFHEVTSADPLTYYAVFIALMAHCCLDSYRPARRAALFFHSHLAGDDSGYLKTLCFPAVLVAVNIH
jgi:hypothetical protein